MTKETFLANAIRLGTQDGLQAANEAREQESWVAGQSSDWDAGLINNLGTEKTAELLGVELDSPEWTQALQAYNRAAINAWDAA